MNGSHSGQHNYTSTTNEKLLGLLYTPDILEHDNCLAFVAYQKLVWTDFFIERLRTLRKNFI